MFSTTSQNKDDTHESMKQLNHHQLQWVCFISLKDIFPRLFISTFTIVKHLTRFKSIDSDRLADLEFKDKFYLNVTSHKPSYENIQMNGTEIHQNSGE